jgi:hypothetical protein
MKEESCADVHKLRRNLRNILYRLVEPSLSIRETATNCTIHQLYLNNLSGSAQIDNLNGWLVYKKSWYETYLARTDAKSSFELGQ